MRGGLGNAQHQGITAQLPPDRGPRYLTEGEDHHPPPTSGCPFPWPTLGILGRQGRNATGILPDIYHWLDACRLPC